MKYGESAFDILYLLFVIISGIVILRNAKNWNEKYMGWATIILGVGDSFHLVPRVLNYFVKADFTMALGVGKLVTSITMTIFYVMLYYVWVGYFHKGNRSLEIGIFVLAGIRCILCLFPQNGWFSNKSDVTWGIIRNVPFVIMGAMVCYLFYKTKKEDKTFRFMWLYVLLSFAFYMTVAIGASKLPILGMLMLPKTVCYILMIIAFINKQKEA